MERIRLQLINSFHPNVARMGYFEKIGIVIESAAVFAHRSYSNSPHV